MKDPLAQWLFDDSSMMVENNECESHCEALFCLWNDYLKFWRQRSASSYKVKCFTLNTIGLGSSLSDYPTLASTIKGMKCKLIFFWLTTRCICAGNNPAAKEYVKERAQAAYHIVSYIDILDQAELILSETEAKCAVFHGWSFLRWYQYFAHSFYANGVCGYKLRPKLHAFAHQLLELLDTRENPAKMALWAAEDLVGQIKKLGNKTSSRSTHFRVALRRSLFVSLRARRATGVFKSQLKTKIMR